uniref:Uncharacterized protein n=1 Tax=Chromera velia CCMP2878 TaxID=1169474 RepID=A0A0G4ICJ6_9ALVE|eukprot:Cvel_13055.t1-p1 / transcript=Cvel_13055.t1 / gene=Cvel_13055 / organism=Chromera_velia_CCMP2878 / gene_product=hypothetical protein / transcript_product=hypothetical protein / location=Cvel_scaffold878:48532-51217(-) / protein_length=578 / sequence_SO=supercontig / SO=protein_coding / is_pseudo=false
MSTNRCYREQRQVRKRPRRRHSLFQTPCSLTSASSSFTRRCQASPWKPPHTVSFPTHSQKPGVTALQSAFDGWVWGVDGDGINPLSLLWQRVFPGVVTQVTGVASDAAGMLAEAYFPTSPADFVAVAAGEGVGGLSAFVVGYLSQWLAGNVRKEWRAARQSTEGRREAAVAVSYFSVRGFARVALEAGGVPAETAALAAVVLGALGSKGVEFVDEVLLQSAAREFRESRLGLVEGEEEGEEGGMEESGEEGEGEGKDETNKGGMQILMRGAIEQLLPFMQWRQIRQGRRRPRALESLVSRNALDMNPRVSVVEEEETVEKDRDLVVQRELNGARAGGDTGGEGKVSSSFRSLDGEGRREKVEHGIQGWAKSWSPRLTLSLQGVLSSDLMRQKRDLVKKAQRPGRRSEAVERNLEGREDEKEEASPSESREEKNPQGQGGSQGFSPEEVISDLGVWLAYDLLTEAAEKQGLVSEVGMLEEVGLSVWILLASVAAVCGGAAGMVGQILRFSFATIEQRGDLYKPTRVVVEVLRTASQFVGYELAVNALSVLLPSSTKEVWMLLPSPVYSLLRGVESAGYL